MIKLRDRFGYYTNPGPAGITRMWYDGPILVIWVGRFYIDLSYTRLAAWALRDWFGDGRHDDA